MRSPTWPSGLLWIYFYSIVAQNKTLWIKIGDRGGRTRLFSDYYCVWTGKLTFCKPISSTISSCCCSNQWAVSFRSLAYQLSHTYSYTKKNVTTSIYEKYPASSYFGRASSLPLLKHLPRRLLYSSYGLCSVWSTLPFWIFAAALLT